jgi:hypothetical protein
MKMKVGDTIKTRVWSLNTERFKMGVITSINLALDYTDKKAERGIEIERYDTELDYIGTVSYNDKDNNSHWTYFNQIVSVIPQEENIDKLCDDIVHQQLFGI